jgi:hypothetical protein
MPPAVAMAVPAIAGAGAQAAGGKKGQGAAQQAANQQFSFQNKLFDTAQSAWQPAANYFKTLLSGNQQQIAAAVGPTSDILKQQAQAQAQQIAATTPSGGAQVTAQQQNLQNQYNQMSRLYAGVQPQAAMALGQLSQAPMAASAPNVGSGMKYDTHQQEMQNQSKGALGSGVGQLAGSKRGGGKNSSSTVPSSNPTGAFSAGFSQAPTEGYT